ncbi:PRC-barrel domain containing protein [Paraburkholderia hayleyella]|uniref:PRC-barrel domain containing protein n=1 Tax=Paraburkholderia hayleyella TaxID=2152889 RepID=UPI001291F4A9|nr:PRC-barrel domain containing protein [Paraburkholderia hayleyella]
MSGGVLPPVSRLPFWVLLMVLVLSGCSAFGPPQQAPAPISEAIAVSVEPPAPPPPVKAPPPPIAVPPKPVKRPVVKPRPVKPQPAPPPPPATPTPLITLRTIGHGLVRGLLDSEVQRPDGRVIGHAVDLIADASGRPHEMVVNLQGFMGVGDRKVNFPWSAFSFKPDAAPKMAAITLQRLPNPPPVPIQNSTRLSATATQLPLLDSIVERPNHTTVGRVIDALIDSRAQPQALVLDVNDIVAPGRHSIAVDWNALHFVTRNKVLQLQLDLDDAQLKASPPYLVNQPVVHAISPAVPAPVTVTKPASAASSAATRAASRSRGHR